MKQKQNPYSKKFVEVVRKFGKTSGQYRAGPPKA